MALTITTPTTDGRSHDVWGARHVTITQVTFDSDYDEGGESFDPRAGLAHPGVVVQVVPSARAHARGVTVQYNHATKKLVAFGNGGTSASNVTAKSYGELCHCDLSALVVDVIVVGE